jgi:hypothetical protein
MMDQELKQKWIKALRSRKYKQARSSLHMDGKYCCLGVLMAIQNAKDFRYLDKPIPDKCFLGGLSTDVAFTLAAANDGTENFINGAQMRKHSFLEIADYLERERGI